LSQVRIFRSLSEARAGFAPSALTVGNFDGVHLGHRELMRRVHRLAEAHGVKPSVVTFHPHPTHVVAPQRAPKLLTTPEERCELIAQEGIGQILVLPFDAAVSHLSPEQFVSTVLHDALGARAVVVGDNFHFGYRQAGHVDMLKQLGARFGFEVEVVRTIRWRGLAVSSSEIRRLITEGDVSKACRLLGRPVVLSGRVVPGAGRGSRQTVPTLNLQTSAEVLPATGVYITRTHDTDCSRRWPSVTNIGFRPTFGGTSLTIETFLLAPLDSPSPANLRIEFLRRVRAEKKFESPDALKTQILRDAAQARSWFRRLERWVHRVPVRVR
jgi:riboflavin kinase / FMN adenylyltransferase